MHNRKLLLVRSEPWRGVTQTVSGVGRALKGATGTAVTVSTGPSTNGTKLPAGTYSNYHKSGPFEAR